MLSYTVPGSADVLMLQARQLRVLSSVGGSVLQIGGEAESRCQGVFWYSCAQNAFQW
jgi:hypothetical protein